MGIKERQDRERHAVRASILTAARDLFVTEGYANVSIRKVAERIEYSPAAIYIYFPGKDYIFFALATEGFQPRDAIATRPACGSDAGPAQLLVGVLPVLRDQRGSSTLQRTARCRPSPSSGRASACCSR
jgi:AcrR family transcriptional regulator